MGWFQNHYGRLPGFDPGRGYRLYTRNLSPSRVFSGAVSFRPIQVGGSYRLCNPVVPIFLLQETRVTSTIIKPLI